MMCPTVSEYYREASTWSIAPTYFMLLSLEVVTKVLLVLKNKALQFAQVDVLDIQTLRSGLWKGEILVKDERKAPSTMNVRMWGDGIHNLRLSVYYRGVQHM